jgi:hypothetical protein
MHKDAMDICLYTNKISDLGNKLLLHVAWYNLGYNGFPWLIQEEYITLKNTENWVDISDKFMHTRLKSGLPQ